MRDGGGNDESKDFSMPITFHQLQVTEPAPRAANVNHQWLDPLVVAALLVLVPAGACLIRPWLLPHR